jgi:hypothetical protein
MHGEVPELRDLDRATGGLAGTAASTLRVAAPSDRIVPEQLDDGACSAFILTLG